MDCSLTGSSVHEIFQARVLELGSLFLLQGILLTQGSNAISYISCIIRQVLYHLEPVWPRNPTIGHILWENHIWKRHICPRCSSTDEWIKKVWCVYTHTHTHTHTQEYYSARKRNAFELVLMRRMNLEPVREWSQSEREKQILYINSYIWNLEGW